MNRALRARQRRRERMRLALVLCLLAVGGNLALGFLSQALGVSGAPRVLMNAASTLLCFGLTAWLGLRGFDLGPRAPLPMGMLSMAQIRALSALGVLAIAPVTLLADIPSGIALRVMARMGAAVTTVQSAPPPMMLFAAMLVSSALVAPICEELFFRGYLFGEFREYGEGRAALASALLFALAHGVDAQLPLRALLGLLFAALAMRTGSLLAPMLVHACYNAAVLLASFTGLGALFTGLSLPSCALRLIMSAGFFAVLRRAWAARGTRMPARAGDGRPLRAGQWALLILAGAALAATLLLAGVRA